MPSFSERDYAKFAAAVCADYVDKGIPLNDSIDKLASHYEMNGDQLQRLCEAANNTTFNKLFQKQASGSDRMVSFPVADSKALLSKRVKAAQQTAATEKTASYSELWDLPNEHETLPEAKTASDFEERVPTREIPRWQLLATLEKVAETLRLEKIAMDMAYQDALRDAKWHFARTDARPFETFEREGAALYKQASEAPLADLRRLFGMPEVVYNFDVLTKTAGLIDTGRTDLKILGKLIDTGSRRDTLGRALDKLAAEVAHAAR